MEKDGNSAFHSVFGVWKKAIAFSEKFLINRTIDLRLLEDIEPPPKISKQTGHFDVQLKNWESWYFYDGASKAAEFLITKVLSHA